MRALHATNPKCQQQHTVPLGLGLALMSWKKHIESMGRGGDIAKLSNAVDMEHRVGQPVLRERAAMARTRAMPKRQITTAHARSAVTFDKPARQPRVPIFGRLALKPPVSERVSRPPVPARHESSRCPRCHEALEYRGEVAVDRGDGAADGAASDLYRCPVHGLWRIYVSGYIVALGGGPAL